MKRASTLLALAMLAGGISAAAPALAKPVNVKLATLAPDGSSWHELLKDLSAEWEAVSDGRVRLRVFAGGVAGDEPAVIKKIGINNYQAALITSHGLSSISRVTRVFTVPFMLRSDAEVAHAMETMAAEMDAELLERGYVVLSWAYAGWVNFFVPKPETSVDAVRKLKLFTWAGDPDTAELWEAAGFKVVPLPATDLLSGLKTNLIDAFDTTPVYALTSQAYRQTPYMIDLKWAPLTGALIINRETWEAVPAELRPRLLEASRGFGDKLIAETRRMEADAITAMKERGLTVLAPPDADRDEWLRLTLEAYPKIRGKYVDEASFDRIQQIVTEYRKANGEP